MTNIIFPWFDLSDAPLAHATHKPSAFQIKNSLMCTRTKTYEKVNDDDDLNLWFIIVLGDDEFACDLRTSRDSIGD